MALAMPEVRVDRSSAVPLYVQLAQQLEQMIASGTLNPGTRLDNEVALAERLGVSRPTMRSAIAYLVDRGLLVRKRGVGTKVVSPRVRRPAELTSLYDDLERSGQQPRTEVLSLEVAAAPEPVAQALGLEPGTDVYVLQRLRHAGDEPLALMRNYLPTALAELEREQLASRGLYDVLRSAGVVPKMAQQTIGAKAASAAEARSLGETRGAPLLTMQRLAWDSGGGPVELGSHLYRASRYSFELTLSGT